MIGYEGFKGFPQAIEAGLSSDPNAALYRPSDSEFAALCAWERQQGDCG